MTPLLWTGVVERGRPVKNEAVVLLDSTFRAEGPTTLNAGVGEPSRIILRILAIEADHRIETARPA